MPLELSLPRSIGAAIAYPGGLAAMAVILAAPVQAQTFTDVPEGHWAYAFIEELASREITSGCGGGQYCPQNYVTRAEMAVFLLRAAGPQVVDGNGNTVGSLLEGGNEGWFEVLTKEGYVFDLSIVTGEVRPGTFYYATADCTGTPYMVGHGGHVARVGDALWVIAKEASPVTEFFIGSYFNGLVCGISGYVTNDPVWPVMVNDPGVTGVGTTPSPLPINIERW